MRNLYGIAFYGEQGAGKSTAAKYIAENFEAYRGAFAQALRREAAYIVWELMGATQAGMYSYEQILADMETYGLKEQYRDLLRWLGPWRRAQDKQYWVRKLDAEIKEYLASHSGDTPLVTVEDVRYDNERDYLVSRGFVFVLVDRIGLDRSHDKHDSETDWRNWQPDHVLYNNSRVNNLHMQVRDMLAIIRKEDE
jgi:hypothetical protein